MHATGPEVSNPNKVFDNVRMTKSLCPFRQLAESQQGLAKHYSWLTGSGVGLLLKQGEYRTFKRDFWITVKY